MTHDGLQTLIAGVSPHAIVSMLETATSQKAFSVGKPSPVMRRAARADIGLRTEQTTMIGDTMKTDILGGVQMGYRTILTLSGGTRREDLHQFAYSPNRIVDSVADLCDDDLLLTAPDAEEVDQAAGIVAVK